MNHSPILRRGVLGVIVTASITVASFAAPDPRYHDYDEVLAFFDDWAAEYPDIFHREVIGYTLVGEEPIWAARISDNAAISESEPGIMIKAAIHANEINGVNTIIYMMDRLLTRYGQQSYYTDMVDNIEMWFVPILNVDGTRMVFAGGDHWDWWRKSKRDNNGDEQYTYPIDGVDMNRNWDYRWAEYDSTQWESSRYKGPYPWSEPEVVAMRDFILQERPVFLMDLHSPDVPTIGRKIWWPWYDPNYGTYGPDRYIYAPICTTLGNRTESEQNGVYYDGDGPCYNQLPKEQCWAYANTGICAFLMEISRQYWWTGATIDTIAARTGRGLFYLMERTLSGPGLTGTVTDSLTGLPLVAEVRVQQVHDPDIGPRLTEADHGRYDRLLNAGSYTVTVSADGYWSQTESIYVSGSGWTELDFKLYPTHPPTGPVVILGDVTVDDDLADESYGNDDGDADAGETIELLVSLRNVGTETATNVGATLETEDPYCEITDDFEGFGSIPIAGEATCWDDFNLEIDPACPSGHTIPFSLTVTSTNRTTWDLTFELTIGAPTFSLVSYAIDDDAGGDGDGRIDPGETVGLSVLLGNTGSADATGLEIALETEHPLVTISQGQATLADLPQGGQGTPQPAFELSVSPGCPDPEVILAGLAIEADWDVTAGIPFEIPVGGLFDDVESGAGNWIDYVVTDGFNNQWHRSQQRNYTPGGTWSWKFGDTGAGDYANLADGALESEPVTLRDESVLRFRHWMDAEVSSAYPGYCYDGGMVELSVDGGHWTQIFPAGGYTHRIRGTGGPWPVETEVFSGDINWDEATFDITGLGGEARFRFRFGSDNGTGGEGWYIDNVEFFGTGDLSGVDDTPPLALHPVIGPNSPNPFGPRTVIEYRLPEAGEARLQVFDAAGRLVRTLAEGRIEAGSHLATWDGRDHSGRAVAAGVYLYRFQSPAGTLTRKMTLTR